MPSFGIINNINIPKFNTEEQLYMKDTKCK